MRLVPLVRMQAGYIRYTVSRLSSRVMGFRPVHAIKHHLWPVVCYHCIYWYPARPALTWHMTGCQGQCMACIRLWLTSWHVYFLYPLCILFVHIVFLLYRAFSMTFSKVTKGISLSCFRLSLIPLMLRLLLFNYWINPCILLCDTKYFAWSERASIQMSNLAYIVSLWCDLM